MPKINVYLPDDLAEAVRDTGVPVSAVCQRSLEQAVRRVVQLRAALAGELDTEQALARLTELTARTRTALALGIEQARARGAASVDTGHVLGGILAEGTNLAVRVLAAAEVDLDRVRADLEAPPARPAEPLPDGSAADRLQFSGPASAALQAAVTEALSLDHNYVGCEHLLLGLAAGTDGRAGEVLRAHGADHRTLRRAVVAALTGYVHLRAQGQQATAAGVESVVAEAVRHQLAPLVERLAALERHVGAPGPA